MSAFLVEMHMFILKPDTAVFCLGKNFNDASSGVLSHQERSLFVPRESYVAVRSLFWKRTVGGRKLNLSLMIFFFLKCITLLESLCQGV